MASVLKSSKKYVKTLCKQKRNRELYKIYKKKKVRKKATNFASNIFLLDIHGISCRDIQHIVGTKYSAR